MKIIYPSINSTLAPFLRKSLILFINTCQIVLLEITFYVFELNSNFVSIFTYTFTWHFLKLVHTMYYIKVQRNSSQP